MYSDWSFTWVKFRLPEPVFFILPAIYSDFMHYLSTFLFIFNFGS